MTELTSEPGSEAQDASKSRGQVPMSTAMSAIYEGQLCVGFILRRRKEFGAVSRFEAFSRNGQSLGLFSTTTDAADAISSAGKQDEPV
jgi:hypothetical protein